MTPDVTNRGGYEQPRHIVLCCWIAVVPVAIGLVVWSLLVTNWSAWSPSPKK